MRTLFLGRLCLVACLAATTGVAQATEAVSFHVQHQSVGRDLEPYGQAATPDGGSMICGEATLVGTSASRPYVMKLDDHGAVEWCREYELLEGLHRATRVHRIATHRYAVLVDLLEVEGAALLFIDAAGAPASARRYFAGAAPLKLLDLVPTRDAGYLMVGYTSNVQSGDDAIVLKADRFGELQWHHRITGAIPWPRFGADDRALGAFAAVGSSDLYVTGMFESDAWLMRLDRNGRIVFQQTYRLSGMTIFERGLHLHQRSRDGLRLIVQADLRNDLFPVLLELDGDGVLQEPTARSFPVSATKATRTLDGGFAVSGSSLLGGGYRRTRLLKYGPDTALEWAFEYDLQPSWRRPNPPLNLLAKSGGGYLMSVSTATASELAQGVLQVEPTGGLACGATPLVGESEFIAESGSATVPTVTKADPQWRWLDFTHTAVAVATEILCAGPPLAGR
ncbi:MAG: hypothetical protein AAF628_10350 [Planctomycetota bacterium]